MTRRFWLRVVLVTGVCAAGITLLGCRSDAPSGSDGRVSNLSPRDTTDRSGPTSGVDPAAFSFTEVTERSGLAGFQHYTGARGDKLEPENMGSGGAFVDLDGDGWLDVVLVGGGYWGERRPSGYRSLWIYRNTGDGEFELVTEEVGLADVSAYGYGIAAADYDRDGDTDLFLTALRRNHLFENREGRFVDVTESAGLGDVEQWSTSALFSDADRDGRPDLWVGGYIRWSPASDLDCSLDGSAPSYCTPDVYEGVPTRFYRNEGAGRFVAAGTEAGVRPNPGKALGFVELDYDDDDWPDVFVASDLVRNLLFRNRGDGTFREVGMMSGVAVDPNGNPRAGMGVDAGVLDGTGRPSIVVGNFTEERFGVFRYEGNGIFSERSLATGLADPSFSTLTFGLFLADLDLDGDLDAFAANGHVQPQIEATGGSYRQVPQFYENRGDGTFAQVSPESGRFPDQALVARGAAYGDYDRDGDLDVLVTENGGGVHLWRNDLGRGRSVRVHLRGTESTTEGLGAELVGWIGAERQFRRIRTGSSYLSQSELTATYGLGKEPGLDSLEVRWPSGRVDAFGSVPGGRKYRLVEGTGKLETTYVFRRGAVDTTIAAR